jgi:phage FluMu protein Com
MKLKYKKLSIPKGSKIRAKLDKLATKTESYHVDVLCPKCKRKMYKSPINTTTCLTKSCELYGAYFSPPRIVLFHRD